MPQVFSLSFPNYSVVWDLLSASKAKFLIIDDTFLDQAKTAPVITLSAIAWAELESLSGNETESLSPPEVRDTDTAIIFHSSGTTSGSPKLIPATHSWIKAFITNKYSLNEGEFQGQNIINTLGSLAHVGSFCGAFYPLSCDLIFH